MDPTQDPFPYFERFPDADILTSSDEVVNSVDDDRLEFYGQCKLMTLVFSGV